MSEEDALLAAIAAQPDEDTPRLAYADWLDEHGRPIKAEFIRVQIEIARVETLPRIVLNRYVDVFKRNQELIDDHRSELLGPLACLRDAATFEFRRGFVAEIRTDVSEFVVNWATIGDAIPPPRVVVFGRPFRVREFMGFDADKPLPARPFEVVSALRIHGFGNDEDRSAERLAAPRYWPRLDELDLSGCRLGDDNIAALLRPDAFPILADLDLSGNDLTDAGVASLLDSGLPRQLKRLILGGNPITDQGAIELAGRWPRGDADKLEHLNMRHTDIGPPGQQALLSRFGGRIDLF